MEVTVSHPMNYLMTNDVYYSLQFWLAAHNAATFAEPQKKCCKEQFLEIVMILLKPFLYLLMTGEKQRTFLPAKLGYALHPN